MRRNNIEFIRNEGDSRPPEIAALSKRVIGEGEVKYTLAWFHVDDEGYYMTTIGDRFTEHKDSEDVMIVAKYALRSLQNSFEFNHEQ